MPHRCILSIRELGALAVCCRRRISCVKLGILSPLLYSHTCASVCVPTSPNLAASGCSPIPTLSNIIHITLFIKSNPFLVERRSAISDIFLSYCTAHYYVYYTLNFYFIQSYNTRIVGVRSAEQFDIIEVKS